jgi:hypothetical protein
VNRLVSATLYDGPAGGGTQKQQSYTFDAFGNLTSIAGTTGRMTPTSAQTNRLTGVVGRVEVDPVLEPRGHVGHLVEGVVLVDRA